jgi:hypothetical protein
LRKSGDDDVEQSGKLRISEFDAVERFELFTEVFLQRLTVPDVGAVGVLEFF